MTIEEGLLHRASELADKLRPDERPLFKEGRPAVGGCQHEHFELDDQWKTVTCTDCGERLDPFAVLAAHARWWRQLERKKLSADAATRTMITENLRRLRRLRDVTDLEISQIDELLHRGDGVTLQELSAASRRIEGSAQDRAREIRDARRDKAKAESS